jgi:ABC-type transport auxiliary lipoprotein component
MSDQGRLSFIQAQDGTLVIRLMGVWSLRSGIPSATDVHGQVASTGNWRRVAFDAGELTSWDSSVVTFLVKVSELCRLFLVCLIPAGCGSLGPKPDPSRFFALASLPRAAARAQDAAGANALALGIGPIKFPGYLDRPQLVTRISQKPVCGCRERSAGGTTGRKFFAGPLAKFVNPPSDRQNGPLPMANKPTTHLSSAGGSAPLRTQCRAAC